MAADELKEYIDARTDALAAEFSGHILALMHVVNVLQSQPGYDHERFRATLATLDACAEEARAGRPSPMTPEQQKSFDDAIKFFLDWHPRPLPEPWIVRPPKPESAA